MVSQRRGIMRATGKDAQRALRLIRRKAEAVGGSMFATCWEMLAFSNRAQPANMYRAALAELALGWEPRLEEALDALAKDDLLRMKSRGQRFSRADTELRLVFGWPKWTPPPAFAGLPRGLGDFELIRVGPSLDTTPFPPPGGPRVRAQRPAAAPSKSRRRAPFGVAYPRPRRPVDRSKLPQDARSVALRRYFACLRDARAAGLVIDRVRLQGGQSAKELDADAFHRLADELEWLTMNAHAKAKVRARQDAWRREWWAEAEREASGESMRVYAERRRAEGVSDAERADQIAERMDAYMGRKVDL